MKKIQSKSSRRDLAFERAKSRFKALFKKWPSWIRRCCFHGFLPPEGDLTKKLYRHKVKDFLIKISFGICSKQLLNMKNRFLILPNPEKLNSNEFLRFKSSKTCQKHNFPKNVENQFCNMLSYVKKCGENGYTISFAPNVLKWHVLAKTHFVISYTFCIFGHILSRRETPYVINLIKTPYL